MHTYRCHSLTVEARSPYYAARKMTAVIVRSDYPPHAYYRIAYTPEPGVFLAFVDYEEPDGSSVDSFFELRPIAV
jgi:hypothetical protein